MSTVLVDFSSLLLSFLLFSSLSLCVNVRVSARLAQLIINKNMWCVYITHDDRRCIQWEGPLVVKGRGPDERGVAHRTPAFVVHAVRAHAV